MARTPAKTAAVAVAAVAGTLLLVLALVSWVYRPGAPSPGGKLVFSDDFERAEIGDAYLQGQPDRGWSASKWKIEKGRLRAEKIHNAALWLQMPLPKQVRVEFDARALSETGDVKCEIFGDGRTHQSGYILIAGGWNNAINCIARQDEHQNERKEDRRCPRRGNRAMCVEPNVDYKWTVVRTDHVVRWYLDDVLFLTYDDADPVQGRHFAFNNWEAPVAFDNLRIYDLAQ